MDRVAIENMTCGELKAVRNEAVEAMKEEPSVLLAGLYITVQITAKLRDEKLAEQGRTITLLQENAEITKARIVQAESRLEAAEKARLQDGVQITNLAVALQEQAAQLNAVEAKAARYRQLVEASSSALQNANSAVASAQNAVMTAIQSVQLDAAEHGN